MASKDKIYMVMEFMSGGELFDKIVADGPLEVSHSFAASQMETPCSSTIYHAHAQCSWNLLLPLSAGYLG